MGDSPLDPREHITEPANIEQARRGIGARRAQQHVIGLVLAQHVVDQVGREQHLPPGLFLAGEAAGDQAGDDGAGAEGALHQCRFRQPRLEIVTQHVRIEQRVEIELSLPDHERHVAERPDGQRIFVGDKAERPGAGALQPPRQEHAEGLMRQPPLEGITDEVMLVGARKSFHHQFARAGNARQIGLQRQPVAHLVRQRAPGALVRKQLAHPLGEIGRERKLAAHVGRHLCVLVAGAGDVDMVFRQRLVANDLAAEDKGVADHQALNESIPRSRRAYGRRGRARRSSQTRRRASAPAAPSASTPRRWCRH